MTSTLEQIVSDTRARMAGGVNASRRSELESMALRHTPRAFRSRLAQVGARGLAIIAELKKASPSRGLIREDFPVADLALELEQAGAAALSVLTEEKYFLGSLDNMLRASQSVSIPCLRKDFIVDELQLLEARAYGGDAALLIVAALSDAELKRLSLAARELELDILCEVHDEHELRRAVDLGFDIVGVNNRNLRTFEVTLETCVRLHANIPAPALRVAESGIESGADIGRLRGVGYQAFLIGESLMKQARPGEGLRKLIADAARMSPMVEAARP
jgi:indole-3-glycerol phosphate synthase